MGILNQLSPGIAVNEVDLTGIIPAVSTSVGAFAGQFNWGPANTPRLITDENELAQFFGKPTRSETNYFAAECFFSCASFLAYTNSLYIVRTVGANAYNASANANSFMSIKNEDEYENVYELITGSQGTNFLAKYPGALGNSLRVSVCANSAAFSSWYYRYYFDNAPGTSNFIYEKSGLNTANDEMHIIVVDSKGLFSGKANTVLEKFAFLSKARDVIDTNGRNSYYKEYLKENSQYIYCIDHPNFAQSNSTWGYTSTEVSQFYNPPIVTADLSGGADGAIPTEGELLNSWYVFKNKDQYEISLAFIGSQSANVAKSVLDNVILGVESETPTVGRRDTVLFVSPGKSDVVDQAGQEVNNIITDNDSFLNKLNRSSSYMVADCGWKKMYDRYNNVYRWIPLNPDIAGLCAYTDQVADPWWSPGGYNRGKLKNVVSLAWSPNLAERDQLYKNGINPVISQRGEGIVLLGDKTMQAKPSAFDRINVRRLFITLEKAISRAARYTLFEFNDEFTRAQFVAMVEPYLRTVKGRRGIIDFKVVCDESNNTPDIIDRNGFVGDIYIKPARSINFIQLNFVAVKTGVEFTTVIGQF